MNKTVRQAPSRHRRSTVGRGVLVLISSLLVASALLRFASGPGAAIARETGATPPPGPLVVQAAAEAQREHLAATLEELRNREARLAAKERTLEDRLEALSIAEARIQVRMAELIDAEEALRGTISMAEGAAEGDLSRLTSVYENMKPKESAALFETMDPEFAAGFLGRMRPDLAAGIMAGLSPEVAYSISVVLAGRNARVPTE